MEDLAPLIFFLIIVVVNVAKFFLEKEAKKKATGRPAGAEPPPRRQPSSLEQFFENLAKQAVPQSQPTPSYTQTLTTFEADEPDVDLWEEIVPAPTPMVDLIANLEEPGLQSLERPAAVAAIPKGAHALFSGSHGLRMPGNTFISNGKVGNSGFRITGKKALKNALISHIIFSPPRAYDLSYENTLIK